MENTQPLSADSAPLGDHPTDSGHPGNHPTVSDSTLTELHHSIAILTRENNELLKRLEQRKEEFEDKDRIISEQTRKIHQLYHQIDIVNVRLSEIYSSEGWKLLSIYYRFKGKLLPADSPHSRKLKKIVNWIRGKKVDAAIESDPMGLNNYYLDYAATTDFDPFEFPYFANPKVSIIVPAYNGWEVNYRCLRSIKDNTEGTSYEVIFADDVSTDETRNIRQYIKNMVVVRNDQNLGFLKNCNHAASFAKGEYVHFLNNDTVVTPGWLSSLVEPMEKDPAIGMTGSKLVYPNGRLQEAGGIIWRDASGANYGHKQDPGAPEFNYVKEVDYISGASILVRKSLWQKLGGFNEMYTPAYCEDTDLAFSIRKEGFSVVYQPLSTVIHYEGYSHGTDNNKVGGQTGIKSYQKTNMIKLAAKWRSDLEQQFPNGVNSFWARDRSRHKKTIVVIDHYVPQFDKDAGSKTVFQYLSLFVEMGMNVKFIGDDFYRHEPYTTILQQKGIEVLYGDYYAKNWIKWLKDNEQYIDYVFLNRPHISIKYINAIKKHMHGKLFYYIHDLHFLRELKEYEITKDKNTLSLSKKWKKTEYTLFTQSDTVLTPSIKEKEIIQADFPKKPVQVMPAFFYSSIGDPIKNFNQRKDILFVGGFNHKPNIDAVLWFTNEIFPLIRKKDKELKLLIVGSKAPAEITSLASPDIIIRGFVSEEELENIYANVRFAIVPLRYGAGVKGKTVESLSKGLPVVSTSFGIEGLKDIESFMKAYDDADAFAEAVVGLYNNFKRLEELSALSVAYAKMNFTKDAAGVFFKKLFNI